MSQHFKESMIYSKYIMVVLTAVRTKITDMCLSNNLVLYILPIQRYTTE